MRLVIQRVSEGEVVIDGVSHGRIGRGVVVLVGFGEGDTEALLAKVADKLIGLRIFADAGGNTNLALGDVGGGILLVSQFTLYADVRKGRRPSFTRSLAPEPARQLYETFVERVRAAYTTGPVESGVFGAMMQVRLVNDGPVTIWLDSAELGL
ncbi:MAG: D-tyrosyl-tRNA(Tyr) deacylase [Candidatus Sumerlaeia bacterium]|nr:D-tyrosyl-tRNA(Tyr) deacylase [Candidatus Sumerlaeia bacterium]